MNSVKDLYQSLVKARLFQEWLTAHAGSYLSHFFSSLSSSLQQKSTWEIGFFNQATQKITVFLPTEHSFMIKNEDDIFKNETSTVEKLELADVVTTFDKAAAAGKEHLSAFFPQESLGEGFVVLQKFAGKVQWNFTLVTASLKFANLKINAETGAIDSHQLIEAVRRENGHGATGTN